MYIWIFVAVVGGALSILGLLFFFVVIAAVKLLDDTCWQL